MNIKNKTPLLVKKLTKREYARTKINKLMYALPFLAVLGILPSEAEAGGLLSRLLCCGSSEDVMPTTTASSVPPAPSMQPASLTPEPEVKSKRGGLSSKIKELERQTAINAVLAEALHNKYRNEVERVNGYIKIFIRVGIDRLQISKEEKSALITLMNEDFTGEILTKKLHSQETAVKEFVDAAILRVPEKERVALRAVAERFFSGRILEER